MNDGLRTATERLRRFVELRSALETIRDNQGKVCGQYEICDHPACESSYASWAIADEALSGGNGTP